MEQQSEDQPDQGGNEQPTVELLAALPPQAQKAVEHPVRREILRTLNGSGDSRTSIEIAATTLPTSSISVINYHALVLEATGSIGVTGMQPNGGGLIRLYASNVTDDQQIISFLKATRQLDGHDG